MSTGYTFDEALNLLQAPFIVAERSSSGFQIEGLYQDVSKLADFEPIDVIDGRTLIWDAVGHLLTLRAALDSVDEGQFDHAAGEPRVEITPDPHLNLLLKQLVEYLGGHLNDQLSSPPAAINLHTLIHRAEAQQLIAPRM